MKLSSERTTFHVAIHDVHAGSLGPVHAILDALAPLVGPRVSLAVTPHRRGRPLRRDGAEVRALARRVEEIHLHGWSHRRARGRGIVGRLAGLDRGALPVPALHPADVARGHLVHAVPLARAKAISAYMLCAREVFDTFGPFDTSVEIAVEWPLLAGPYRARRERFVFDRSIAARSSSRRMEMRRLGYLPNGAKCFWAVLHRSGHRRDTDRYRAPAGAER